MKNSFIFSVLLLLFACSQQSPPLSSEAQSALNTFEVMDGFRIELIASEPLVADPVAMEIDEYGRMYVVEMHGYPLDTEGSGKVKLLEDTDEDGLPDKSTLFAEGLILPTGIMRWKNGVIVTDAPDVWYLEDSDDDGKADIKKKMLTGFARSNPQHNLNTPVYGLDNWIYLAHESSVSTKFFHDKFGDEGSEIIFPEREDKKLPRNANGRNVRFRPDTYELEAMSGESQFGITFDCWGHQLLTSNATHLFHEVIAAPYVQRNPHLAIPDATAYLPSYGRGVEVFPITKNPEHQLLTDVGTITSACGVSWYQGDLFPEEFRQVTFVAEPVHNLVHADVITDKGASFRADRLLENAEFLASTDSWFRPVNFYQGPDGALYLIDYYRKIIEHPEWMSEEVNNSGQLYEGTDMGRIYRIVPEDAAAISFMNTIHLGDEDNESLVTKLSHPNLWWRRHAQRLLLDRKATGAENALQEMVLQDTSAVGRLHALWTLEGLDIMREETLLAALKDKKAGVRENAIKIAERYTVHWPAVKSSLYKLASDDDAKVRFQLICSLGAIEEKQAREIVWQLLEKDINDEWVQYAALSSANGYEEEWLSLAIAQLGNKAQKEAAPFFKKLAASIANSGNQQAINDLIITSTKLNENNVWWQAAALEGLANGLSTKTNALPQGEYQRRLLTLISPQTPDELRRASLHLLTTLGTTESPQLMTPALERASQALTAQNADPAWRTDAIRFLAMSGQDKYISQLTSLIQPQEPVLVQKAAIQSFSQSKEIAPCSMLLEKWMSLTPELRDEAINIFGTSQERMLLLLDAVENKQVDPSTIGWRRSVELMNHDDETVRNKARMLLADSKPNEAEVVSLYQPALALEGNAQNGLSVYSNNCARCHTFAGQLGVSIGPDLSTLRNRSKNAIMEDILMPNKSIADGYELWEISLNNERTLTGIISAESVNSLTLTNLAGQTTTIQRQEIEAIKDVKISAMPSGLEKQINHQQMADLLEFLKAKPSETLQAAMH